MKKRLYGLISFIVTLVMTFSMFPISAMAAAPPDLNDLPNRVSGGKMVFDDKDLYYTFTLKMGDLPADESDARVNEMFFPSNCMSYSYTSTVVGDASGNIQYQDDIFEPFHGFYIQNISGYNVKVDIELNPMTIYSEEIVPDEIVLVFLGAASDEFMNAYTEIYLACLNYFEGVGGVTYDDIVALWNNLKNNKNIPKSVTLVYRATEHKVEIVKEEPNDIPNPNKTPSSKPDGTYYKPLVSQMENTMSQNEGTTITWDQGDSLPYEVMELLAKDSSVSLSFTFTFEGEEYTVFIPAGAMTDLLNEGIPWYGPAWLLEHFDENGRKTPGGSGGYVVAAGDTLGSIAAKFNTTIERLLALNPSITNPDMIYEGQTIKY